MNVYSQQSHAALVKGSRETSSSTDVFLFCFCYDFRCRRGWATFCLYYFGLSLAALRFVSHQRPEKIYFMWGTLGCCGTQAWDRVSGDFDVSISLIRKRPRQLSSENFNPQFSLLLCCLCCCVLVRCNKLRCYHKIPMSALDTIFNFFFYRYF